MTYEEKQAELTNTLQDLAGAINKLGAFTSKVLQENDMLEKMQEEREAEPVVGEVRAFGHIKLLHSSSECEVREITVHPGSQFPAEREPAAIYPANTFYYVLDGFGQITVEDDCSIDISPLDVRFIPKQLPHWFDAGENHELVLLQLCFE